MWFYLLSGWCRNFVFIPSVDGNFSNLTKTVMFCFVGVRSSTIRKEDKWWTTRGTCFTGKLLIYLFVYLQVVPGM